MAKVTPQARPTTTECSEYGIVKRIVAATLHHVDALPIQLLRQVGVRTLGADPRRGGLGFEPWAKNLEAQSQILEPLFQILEAWRISGLWFEPWSQILEVQLQILAPWFK